MIRTPRKPCSQVALQPAGGLPSSGDCEGLHTLLRRFM